MVQDHSNKNPETGGCFYKKRPIPHVARTPSQRTSNAYSKKLAEIQAVFPSAGTTLVNPRRFCFFTAEMTIPQMVFIFSTDEKGGAARAKG